MASTSFNILENKRNVEWLLTQSFKIAVQQNRTDVEANVETVFLGLYS